MTSLDKPTVKPLPASYSRSNMDAPRVRDIHGLVIECDNGSPRYYSSTGEIGQHQILDWILGKNAYTSVSSPGIMDCVLKHLPFYVLEDLAKNRRTSYGKYQIWRSSTHQDISITVRSGHESGVLANLYSVCGDEARPQAIEKATREAFYTFEAYGLPCGDLRSAGAIADAIMNQFSRYNGKSWWTKRPDDLTQHMFLQSFRGARIESTTFGNIEAIQDYDISSAYGWAMGGLCNTRHCSWIRAPELGLVGWATYASVYADINVHLSLPRGPIAYRAGDSHLFYPVGEIKGAWLNLPEIKLLLDYPELGRITKVHKAVWGIPQFGKDQYKPFAPMIEALYKLRKNEPQLGALPKGVMVSCSGKTMSIINGTASRHWNPVISSHITASIRARNFIESLNSEVYGEWTDGFASNAAIESSSGLGRIRLEGSGSMLIAADNVKESSWKHTETGTGYTVEELLQESKDETTMRWNARYNLGLSQIVEKRLDPKFIGREVVDEYRFPLGSSVRLATGPMRGGDLLSGQVGTLPPKQRQIAYLMADWITRGVQAV